MMDCCSAWGVSALSIHTHSNILGASGQGVGVRTNMEWTPRGTTGSGLCEHRCGGGRWENNQWVHQYKIAQGSWQAKGARGRKAHKNMMPAMLHRELLEAAIMHRASAAERREALEAVCRAVN